MTAYELSFLGALVYQFPALASLLQQHLDDYEALLPHVFIADVTRWLVQRFTADPSDVLLRQILNFVELGFAAPERNVEELVAASFLENLPRGTGVEGEISDLLGPSLRNRLGQIS